MRKQFNKDTGCGRPNGRLLHFLYISGGTYCSMGGILNGERKFDAREQRSEIDSVCFSFRIVKIWIYSHLTADFPLMDGYSEAVAGLFIICL